MKTNPNMLRSVLLAGIVALAVGVSPAFAEGGTANPCNPTVEKKVVKKDKKKAAANPCATKASNPCAVKNPCAAKAANPCAKK